MRMIYCAMCVLLAVLFVGCSSGGGPPVPTDNANTDNPADDPAPTPPKAPNPLATLTAGPYAVSGYTDVSSCPEDAGDSFTFNMTIAVDGARVTITHPAGTLTGTIADNVITVTSGLPVTYDDDGGETTLTAIVVNVVTNTELSGAARWTWKNDAGETCKGEDHWEAELIGPPPVPTLTPGDYIVDSYPESGTCNSDPKPVTFSMQVRNVTETTLYLRFIEYGDLTLACTVDGTTVTPRAGQLPLVLDLGGGNTLTLTGMTLQVPADDTLAGQVSYDYEGVGGSCWETAIWIADKVT